MELTGKVVVITGGSRGIGAATARLCASRGATVVVVYAGNQAAADQVVADIEEAGGKAEAVQCDVSDAEACKALIEGVVERHERVDVLVNNAGITRDNLTAVMSDEEWDDVMRVNVGGAFHVARAACRPMMLQRSGVIINLSSVAAKKAGKGQANYAASKAAIEGFTRALAVELARKKIRVNAVAPGVIVTDMTERVRDAAEKEILGEILLKRFGEPDDVARVIAFLASDEASYITGAVIPVDGGFKM